MKLIPARTCTQAWLDAVAHLEECPGNRDYTVILEIKEPLALAPGEKQVYETVDRFLNKSGKRSINTVVNTIFPATLYARCGPDDVLEEYRKIAPTIKGHPDNRWGTYALRMTSQRIDAKGRPFVPIEAIVEKLKRQLKHTSTLRAAYEIDLIDPILDIPIYDAVKDRDATVGDGPCLSHISFKLKEDHSLMLTSFYRSHYYVQRALGNLYGLAWLQDFVAKRCELKTAELVCHSSMAIVEKDPPFKKPDLTRLFAECREQLANSSVKPAPALVVT